MKIILFLIYLSTSQFLYGATQHKVLIIGHRGASGYLPEHTLEAYKKAIELGADFIEPDLVMTKDGHLIARHENEISETTNVATVFPEKKTNKLIDGENKTGWFTEDFTLAEIKKLKARERLPFRDHSQDDQFAIPTWEEIITLVKDHNSKNTKKIGIYPELKHPTYFKKIHLSLSEVFIQSIKKHQLSKQNISMFVQCFELGTLMELKKQISFPLIFLIGAPHESPYDFVDQKDPRTYGDLLKPSELKKLAQTIAGIGPHKGLILLEQKDKSLGPATDLIKNAHQAGLVVHPYTFRSDKQYLHSEYQNDPEKEYQRFFDLKVDGIFSDFPDHASKALQKWKQK